MTRAKDGYRFAGGSIDGRDSAKPGISRGKCNCGKVPPRRVLFEIPLVQLGDYVYGSKIGIEAFFGIGNQLT
jgi:hypothetical protein